MKLRNRLSQFFHWIGRLLDPPAAVAPSARPLTEGVVEFVDSAKWHPGQTGNVIVAEPTMVSNARMMGENVDEI